LLALVLGLLLVSPALADQPWGKGNPNPEYGKDGRHGDPPGRGRGHHGKDRGKSGHPARGHVPELDGGTVGTAALLLIGGTLVLVGRRRRERQA
jgi:hypothetical protein